MRRLLLCVLFYYQCGALAAPMVEQVRVLKSAHQLQLITAGKVSHTFKIALGGQPIGHKQQEGDDRTPEGHYILDYKKVDSAYYRAIHISYPNDNDRAAANARGVSPGGLIMIHGQKNGLGWLSPLSQRIDWTEGCIALSNSDMETLWDLVEAGTKIEILP